MLLRPLRIAATWPSFGETEASSAGEQPVEGYPSRTVTDIGPGRASHLPNPQQSALTVRRCLNNSRPKGGTNTYWPSPADVAIFSGSRARVSG